MKVVDVPERLDYRSFDELVGAVEGVEEGPCLLDAHRLRWVDPLGMTGLLAAGSVLLERTGQRPNLQLPERGEVPGYLARMGFFDRAREILRVPEAPPSRAGRASDVLLEITPITSSEDVHGVVDRVQSRAEAILSRTLRYPASAVVQFSVVLSEVCQNIIEHADAPGWVAAQAYHWQRRLGRHVLLLSVLDLGRGFRGSLEDEHGPRYGDRWGDSAALEAAFLHGITRFHDKGRGQGIQQIRRQVQRWNGAVEIRSGRARIAEVPEWEDRPPLADGLPEFPGAQINVILPGRRADEA